MLTSVTERVRAFVDDTRQELQPILANFRSRTTGQEAFIPDDLRVLDSGIRYDDDGQMDYLWYELEDPEEGGRYFKVVKLHLLRYVPREMREQSNVLEKMRKVLKGMFGARVDFVCVTAGMFDPEEPLGIIQCYGVMATGEVPPLHHILDEATRNKVRAMTLKRTRKQAEEGMVALQATMANFEQSRLEPLDVNKAEWLRQAMESMPFATTIIGHPDPRETSRGMDGRQRGAAGPPAQLSLQQNEMLFRGMAKARQEFVNVVIASRVGDEDPSDIYRLQERVAQEASIWASKERFTRGISVSLSLPLMLSGLLSDGASTAYATGNTHGVSDGVSRTHGVAHTEGFAHSQSHGTAQTRGEAWGEAKTTGVANTHAVGLAHTTGVTHSVGAADSRGQAEARSHVDTEGWGTADSTFQSHTSGSSWSHTTSTSTTTTQGASMGSEVKVSGGIAGFLNFGGGYSVGQNASVSTTTTESDTSGGFESDTHGSSHTDVHSTGVADGRAHTTSRGHTDSTGRADSASITQSVSDALTVSRATTISRSRSRALTESRSEGTTRSVGDSVSDAVGQTHGTGRTVGQVRGQAVNVARMLGVGAGISPSIGLNKTYVGEDHVATLVADALRQQEALLNTIALEGGMMVDNYFLTRTTGGRRALEALVPQAFHGVEEVITPVRTRRLTPAEETYLRMHAFTFTPSTRLEDNRWLLEPWKDSTLLTLLQVAAYTAPGMFEEGPALTTQERIPPFAFVPDMPGEVVLGHQFSYETGDLTRAPARLSRERMSNWAFCADTRFGKSVAAERLTLEVNRRWGFRCFVLDFGLGWRKLLNIAPGDGVDLYSLYEGGPRPIRWNPLQIGRHIPPGLQLDATVELLCNAGRMGERQAGHLWEAIRGLYVEHGVLVDDPDVLEPEERHLGRFPEASRDEKAAYRRAVELAHVGHDEHYLIDAWRAGQELPPLPEGPVRLEDLRPAERHLLAVHRSKHVDLGLVYDRLVKMERRFNRSPADQQAIRGILLRLKSFRHGQLARMYGRGEGSIAIEELGLPHGLVILEGGAMPEYAKAAVLSLIGWRLYTDAVVRRRESIGRAGEAPLFIVFEEGNKVIGGVASGPDSNERPRTTEIFQGMFRDAGKYHIFLGVILQSPSELPAGILSSCNNLMIGQLKNGRDRDVVLPAIARSEKGFMYVDYANYIGRIPQQQMILKLGLSPDVAMVEPLLIRPLLVDVPEPSDADIRVMSET